MSFVIRPRTAEDVPALAQVLVRVHKKDGYPVEGVADPEAWLHSDRTLRAWVAEVEGNAVGQVMITEPDEGDVGAAILAKRENLEQDEIAVLCRLFVDPKHRGEGMAMALVNAAVDASLSAGRMLALDVMLKDQPAIAAYRRMGWRELGEFGHEYAGGLEPALAFYLPSVVS